MASGGPKETGHNLVNVGILTLQTDDLDPWGVVVVGDKLVITDWKSKKVCVYRRHDGMLMSSSDQLESTPYGLCRVNDTDLCVVMHDGIITLMSVQDSGLISRGKTFHLRPSFDKCYGVAAFGDNVVVSGVKDNTIYWCIVSLQDGRHDNLHKVCGGRWSWLTTKENMAYISCDADYDDDCGVYGFNLLNPSQPPYRYKHKGLSFPSGITVDDNGDLFVCDRISYSIHHLTEKCQLVDIYTEGIPRDPVAIFWDSGIMYVASFMSNVITLYKTPHQDPVLPVEILRMDSNSIKLYKKALQDGKEKVYNIRVMVVGQFGVGKTTLIKRLLGQQVDISQRKSTEGIDVHKHCCKISLDKGEWIQQLEDSDQLFRLQRLMKLLSELDQKPDVIEEQGHTEVIYQRESTPEIYSNKNSVDTNQEVPLAFLQQDRGHIAIHVSESKSNESKKKDAVMEILRLINKNADKLKTDKVKYAVLSVWDFAGQYVFYTTHQTFLTSRAIYLLVIDLTQQVMDLVQDDKCFVDTDGIKLCKVHDLVEIWMNSIHTCAPSSEASIPVILVGTHVDKLSEDKRQEIIDKYFPQICRLLKDKPALRHIVKFVPIDNTKLGPQFDNLKGVIFDMASKQPYWGEEVPTSWLPMEEALMELKASGKKVIPRSLVEELNQAASVPIKDAEQLDLFLRFHHEIGTILYFSTDRLKEKIVLDPQWFINALKSLITAETFFLEKYPAIRSKWFELKDNGKLTPELIDAVWTRENNPEFYENKEYMLDVMEKLNIIAKPKSYIEGRQEFKEENYFIAPCMLREKTPQEIICPKPHPQMDNSSVLCYVFLEKFLPAPIFHRLLAACIACWPIATQNKENQIFCGCCIFQLPQNHKLTIHFREHVIFVRVARKGIKDKTPSPKLCMEVRELITTMLNDIIGNLGHNLKFEYCIQCPECNSDTVSGLFPVSQLQENAEVECDFHDMIESHKLLSCWFEEVVKDQEGQGQDDVDPPITQEQINHARLCNALTTVCANALRNILLTNVPAAHTDIYQAILANKSSLKRLNKDQYQLVFPDPQGLSTGKVEEFDISLLYTIIRNVSSVPAPSNGWGNPPATNPRDTTLGASVERIRSYRNSISGHSVDGEIGQHEFEDYWAKIDEVLREIEIVIGNHGYLEDLEKRRNQVITPHEARELQKTFQEYKKQTEAAATGILSALETALSEAKKLQGNKN